MSEDYTGTAIGGFGIDFCKSAMVDWLYLMKGNGAHGMMIVVSNFHAPTPGSGGFSGKAMPDCAYCLD